MTTLMQDLLYSVRQFRKAPGFWLTAVLSLVCGIAATTSIFSVVYGVLVQPYPYAAPDRMVHMTLGGLTGNGAYDGFQINGDQLQQLRGAPIVEDAALTTGDNLMLTGRDLPENVRAEYFSSNGWDFFGVPVLHGRGILPSDAVGTAEPAPVAVLGYKFWQRRFAGDPAIVGQVIQLSHKPYTVVGIAPQRFTWGDGDLYLPLKLVNDSRHAGQAELRLRAGVTHAEADQQLGPLVAQFAKDTPKFFPPRFGALHVIGLNEQFVQALGPTLGMLFAAVVLLLAIGCANVSILLLTRGSMRQHEFAVRSAVGASRPRLIRQLLTESLLLSISGAALGVLLSFKLVKLIVALLPVDAFPHEAAIQVNLPVLCFSVAVALLAGVLFGISPALRLSKPDLRNAMQSSSRRVAGNTGRTLHQALIVSQIALTLLLLTLAGGATQSFLRLANMHLGYDPHNVMAIGLPLRDGAYTDLGSRTTFIGTLRDRLAEVPGVKDVAVSTNATPPDNGFSVPVEVLGVPATQANLVRWNLTSRGYFPLLTIAMHSGRTWTDGEEHSAAQVAVVNQAFVQRYFAGADPLGRSIRTDALKPEPPYVVVKPGAGEWRQIVGVIEDKVDQGLGKPVLPEVFTPYTTGMGPWSQLLVHSDGPPLALLPALSRKIASVDAEQQVSSEIRDLQQWIAMTPEYARSKLISALFAGFAVLALVLACVGLYSVLSYTVAQRTSEFGIRLALGAMRRDVLGLVARSTAVSLGIGAAVGVTLSLLLMQVLNRVLVGAQGHAVLPLLAALLTMLLAGVVAASLPSRRAMRIEPLEAIRCE